MCIRDRIGKVLDVVAYCENHLISDKPLVHQVQHKMCIRDSTIRAFVEYRISKKSKNHWISIVKATVSDTSISSGSISGAEHLLIAIRG